MAENRLGRAGMIAIGAIVTILAVTGERLRHRRGQPARRRLRLLRRSR